MRSLIRRAAVAVLGLAVGATAGLMSALPASAAPVSGPAANGTYLALGDSVAFGYVPPDAVPAPNYRSANSFVGYPEDVGQALRLGVWNASCPGETTESMLVAGAQSNGCENSPGSPIGYRTQFPLHVQYQGTQMEYALKYLAVHRHTRAGDDRRRRQRRVPLPGGDGRRTARARLSCRPWCRRSRRT